MFHIEIQDIDFFHVAHVDHYCCRSSLVEIVEFFNLIILDKHLWLALIFFMPKCTSTRIIGSFGTESRPKMKLHTPIKETQLMLKVLFITNRRPFSSCLLAFRFIGAAFEEPVSLEKMSVIDWYAPTKPSNGDHLLLWNSTNCVQAKSVASGLSPGAAATSFQDWRLLGAFAVSQTSVDFKEVLSPPQALSKVRDFMRSFWIKKEIMLNKNISEHSYWTYLKNFFIYIFFYFLQVIFGSFLMSIKVH